MTHSRLTSDPPTSACRAGASVHLHAWGRGQGLAILALALVVAFATWSPVFAQAVPGVLAEEPLATLQSPQDLRRAELRRALISGADLPVAVSERPSLSRNEREALNRELREAMRGVYESRRAAAR